MSDMTILQVLRDAGLTDTLDGLLGTPKVRR